MPTNDYNFSLRWQLIKTLFRKPNFAQNNSPIFQNTLTLIWQNRFWEHQIRNDNDFSTHFDYIHYNPVKHNYVKAPKNWFYSTFHHYVELGIYPENWGNQNEIVFKVNIGKE